MYTKKEFEQYQHSSSIDKIELNEVYDEYIALYKKEQEREFYNQHKHEHWFIEKYNPEDVFKFKQSQS
jgi:hypothetical protein